MFEEVKATKERSSAVRIGRRKSVLTWRPTVDQPRETGECSLLCGWPAQEVGRREKGVIVRVVCEILQNPGCDRFLLIGKSSQ